MKTKISLIPIDRNGNPRGYAGALPEVISEVFRALAELYKTVGFEEPWIGYLALANETPVSTCSFKSPPRDGRVEIAYFTFPEFEGHGFASAMAARLVAMARQHRSATVVAAQTLPQRNASHRVLEKLGFRHIDTPTPPRAGSYVALTLIARAWAFATLGNVSVKTPCRRSAPMPSWSIRSPSSNCRKKLTNLYSW